MLNGTNPNRVFALQHWHCLWMFPFPVVLMHHLGCLMELPVFYNW